MPSAVVLVFSFALGARTTEHIRTDTIAKWTGHLWVSAKDDFEFKEENLESYRQQARAAAREALVEEQLRDGEDDRAVDVVLRLLRGLVAERSEAGPSKPRVDGNDVVAAFPEVLQQRGILGMEKHNA